LNRIGSSTVPFGEASVLVQRQQEFLLSELTDKKGESSTSFKR
jgi:hypothetical protein